jgi:hypothetical protein
MKPTLAAIVLLALIDAARAADEARFYPPPGWTVTKQLGASMLTPPGVPAGKQCAAMILPDEQGEVNAVFATGWQNVAREWKIVSGGEPIAKRSKGGFETRSTTATALDAAEKSRAYMHFFAVQSGPNVRRALFISDDQATFDKHLPAVKAMFDNVGIDPATIKPLAATAPTTGPGFEGVFYRGSVAFNAAGGRGERVQRVDYLCFAADGRAYNGHPSGGPAACFENEDPRSPSFGRYTLSGDEIVIRWNKQEQPQKLKRRPDGKLEQDGATFHPLASCDDLKLEGTYTVAWADNSKTQVRFFKDGHFKATGLQDCVNLDQLVYPDWPKLPAAGTGTYTIRRNTLEVKYDNDGPARRMFFTTPDNPSNPKRISIANNPLEREP